VADLVFRDLFSGLFVVLGLVALGLSRSKRFLAWHGRSFARNNLAWVDGSLVGEFDAQVKRSLRLAGVGCLVLSPVAWWLADFDQPPGDVQAPVAFLSLMLVVESLILGLPFLYPRRPSAVRAAYSRGREVVLGDYVPPVERRIALLAAAASLALAGAMIVEWLVKRGPVALGVFGPGVLVCLGLAGCICVADRMATALVRKPMLAVDAAHLYWQDARRSAAIRVFYRAAVVQMPIASTAAISQLGHGLPMLADLAVLVVVMGGAITLTCWFLIYELGLSEKPDSHWFRRRLWPDLPPGQVLLPDGVRLPADG
jgi:hypothetical protein